MYKYVCCLILASAVMSSPVDDARDKRQILSAYPYGAASLVAPAPLVAHAPLVSHAPLIGSAYSHVSASSLHYHHPLSVPAYPPLRVAPAFAAYPPLRVAPALAAYPPLRVAPALAAYPPLRVSPALALASGLAL